MAAATIQENRDFVVGVKCRLDRSAAGEMGVVPLRRAIEAAGAGGLPVMAHVGTGPSRTSTRCSTCCAQATSSPTAPPVRAWL